MTEQRRWKEVKLHVIAVIKGGLEIKMGDEKFSKKVQISNKADLEKLKIIDLHHMISKINLTCNEKKYNLGKRYNDAKHKCFWFPPGIMK